MKKIKKFFSNKVVMIGSIVLALTMIGLYIGLLARPISYGMTYKGTLYEGSTKTVTEIVFHRKKYDVKTTVYNNGEKVSTSTDKGEEFKKSDFEKIGFKFTATKLTCKVEMLGVSINQTYKCAATIAFAVYGAILVVAFTGAAVYSTVLVLKRKK